MPTPDQLFFPGFSALCSLVALACVIPLCGRIGRLKRQLAEARAERHDLNADNITRLEVAALKSHDASMFLHGPHGYFAYLRSLGMGMHRMEKL